MNIPGIPDLKTPLLWGLGVALVLALAGLGAQRVKLAEVRAELATVKAQHAEQEKQRAQLAANDAKTVAGAQTVHAATQQEIVHDLTKPDLALAAALADNRALNQRLRDTSAKLAAAGDRNQTQGDSAACGNLADQYRSVLGLLQEAGRLSVQSGELAEEGRSILVRRDGEVKALKAVIINDRALMEHAGGDSQTE